MLSTGPERPALEGEDMGQTSGSITLDLSRLGEDVAAYLSPHLNELGRQITELRARMDSEALTEEQMAVEMLATDLVDMALAAAMARRLTRAGYVMTRVPTPEVDETPHLVVPNDMGGWIENGDRV
jgi:hypothetical protein